MGKPTVVFTYYPLFVRYNHGAALLASICRQNFIECEVEPLSFSFIETVQELDPEWISFSFVTVHDYEASLPYIKQLKQLGFKLMCGGVYCRKGGYIDLSLFDRVCRGEGEILPDFFLNGIETVFTTEYWHESLNDLPLPDYSGVVGDEFHRGVPFLIGKKIIPYSSSRGCPFGCQFCENKHLPPGVRIKTSIKEDTDAIMKAFNPDMILFTDECIPYYMPRWMMQWVDMDIPFSCYIRADMPEESLIFLAERGLKAVAFGVECADERYRNDVLNKELTDEQLWSTVSILDEYNIDYVPFFMSGLPGETDNMKQQTHKLMASIGGSPICWQFEDLEATQWQQ